MNRQLAAPYSFSLHVRCNVSRASHLVDCHPSTQNIVNRKKKSPRCVNTPMCVFSRKIVHFYFETDTGQWSQHGIVKSTLLRYIFDNGHLHRAALLRPIHCHLRITSKLTELRQGTALNLIPPHNPPIENTIPRSWANYFHIALQDTQL